MKLHGSHFAFLFALNYFALPSASVDVGSVQKSCIWGETRARTGRILSLRGGDDVSGSKCVPGVAWSQGSNSLLLKVDMPPGRHSTDGLTISEKHATWQDPGVDLNIDFFAEVKTDDIKMFSDG